MATGIEDRSASAPDAKAEAAEFRRRITFIALGIMAVVLAYPDTGIGKYPLRFLLKDQLHLDAPAVAAFFVLVNIPSWLKIPIGILSDSIPLFGTRRRGYVLLASALGLGLWGVMALVPHRYAPLLVVGFALNAMATVCGTIHGGVVMEEGKRHGATGRIASTRSVFSHIAAVICAYAGGLLATQGLQWTCLAGALIFAGMFILATTCLHEPRATHGNAGAAAAAWEQLVRLVRSRALWAAGGLMFLVQVAPGFATPLFFYQTDTLHFSAPFIGLLGSAQSASATLAGFAYFFLCRRFRLRSVIALCITLNVIGALGYLLYRSQSSALIIECLYGLAGVMGFLCLFDLAARATPKGSEAMGYSVLMVFVNLAMAASDYYGSLIFRFFHNDFTAMVVINAATTSLVLLAVPFLPAALVNRRDGEAAPA